ncbi:hypothetical protein Tco_0871530 [Tanacetum coccineum]
MRIGLAQTLRSLLTLKYFTEVYNLTLSKNVRLLRTSRLGRHQEPCGTGWGASFFGISVVLSEASDKWLSKVQSTQFSGFTEYRVFRPSAVTLEVYKVAGRPVVKSVVEGVLCLHMALQAVEIRIDARE